MPAILQCKKNAIILNWEIILELFLYKNYFGIVSLFLLYYPSISLLWNTSFWTFRSFFGLFAFNVKALKNYNNLWVTAAADDKEVTRSNDLWRVLPFKRDYWAFNNILHNIFILFFQVSFIRIIKKNNKKFNSLLG